jgi:(S)-sulfolactate dehydrogenase
MKKIVISEFMDEAAVDMLRPSFIVQYEPELGIDRAALLDAVKDADALIVRNRTQVDQEVLQAGQKLVAVGRLGVGLENIDVPQCTSRGIDVIPAVGANAAAVAEYVVSVAMLLMRGFLFSSQDVAAGHWPRSQLSSGREAASKTIGIVGFGSIGQTVSALAQAVGMQVIAYDSKLDPSHAIWRGVRRCDDLDTLFRESDAVTLHIPYSTQNANLVDEQRLALMKQTAVLINTARGGIVDETALANALRAGRLAAAAVDVFEHEPLASGSPLADAPNLLLTPHIAGVTLESNVRVSSLIAQRIAEKLNT